MSVKPVTLVIFDDEPCYLLVELNLQSGRGWRRYQICTVVRDDKLADAWLDMGDAKNFKADQFRILGGVTENGKIYIEETVGSLREHANDMRTKSSFDIRELASIG